MAVLGDQHEVLDSDASDPYTIRPRLDGHDVTHSENRCRRLPQIRVFMDVETNPMAGAVHKTLP